MPQISEDLSGDEQSESVNNEMPSPSSTSSSSTSSTSVALKTQSKESAMQHQQPFKSGSHYAGYAASNGSSYGGGAANGRAPSFRRGGGGSRGYQGNSNGQYYGRANSWNNGAAHGNAAANGTNGGASFNGEPTKSHGIEKKIFNDEEYTKISTPRQEVLFKKGSIGKKRPSSVQTAPAVVSRVADHDDSLNGNSAPSSSTPTSPTGDVDSFQYSGNDSASTGDASSTAGEAQSPDTSTQNYDGTPLVCFPMYDYYGGYGGMYPGMGSMLVQTYPGGPLVAAVPVPVPVQPVDWYRTPSGEVQYYYTMGYPPEAAPTEQSSRRNSVESFQSNQASSSQEVISDASMSQSSSTTPSSTTSSAVNSENGGSPCSTGPSSQGPASPQGELASPGAVDVSPVKSATASSSVSFDDHKMAAGGVAGYVYPCAYPPYGMAPPVYAAGY